MEERKDYYEGPVSSGPEPDLSADGPEVMSRADGMQDQAPDDPLRAEPGDASFSQREAETPTERYTEAPVQEPAGQFTEVPVQNAADRYTEVPVQEPADRSSAEGSGASGVSSPAWKEAEPAAGGVQEIGAVKNVGAEKDSGTAQTHGSRASDKKQTREQKAPKKKFSLKEWEPGPNVPNQLTIIRICMIPLFVVFLLWVPKPGGNIVAMIIFILAALTDTADGYIARKYHYVTTFGKFMDPLADKLLVCSALICLVDLGRIESWIVIIIIAREFIISGFRLVAAEKGVVIAANIWGKIKTVVQMLMAILMIGNFGGFLGGCAQFLKWVALVLTLISLATYMFSNRHVLSDQI